MKEIYTGLGERIELSAWVLDSLVSERLSEEEARRLVDEAAQEHNTPQRFYHIFDHPLSMLRLAEEYRDRIRNPRVLSWAIIYHDVIQDTQSTSHSGDNENASAVEAKSKLAGKIPPHEVDKVGEYILLTAHHRHSPHPDIQLLQDLDLAIFGANEDTYQKYKEAIRKEYAHINDGLYRIGRAEVLKKFLVQETIFQTDEFQAQFEEAARRNLQQELHSL